MKAYIPFTGFYESHANEALTHSLDMLIHADDRDIPEELRDIEDGVNWTQARIDYAKEYTLKLFNDFKDITPDFVQLVSPQFYNFETDKILVDMPIATLAKMLMDLTIYDDLKGFKKLSIERHTSYDGFISFIDADIKTWGDLEDWNVHQLEDLITVWLDLQGLDDDAISNLYYEVIEGDDIIWDNLSDKYKELLNTLGYI